MTRTRDDAAQHRMVSPFATGIAVAIGSLMMLTGTFQALEGLAALIDDEFFSQVRNYAFELDATAWGWIHLAIGILAIVVGRYIIRGDRWARMVGMGVTAVSAVASFLFIPYYPLWSVLLIPVDILVIWALAVYRPQTGGVAQPTPPAQPLA